MRRLFLLLLAVCFVPRLILAQTQTYNLSSANVYANGSLISTSVISGTPTPIPAGTTGLTVTVQGGPGGLPAFSSASTSYGFCFYTGTGSQVPLQPSSQSSSSATFSVPDAAVTGLTQSSFTNGTVFVSMFLARNNTTCAATNTSQTRPSNSLPEQIALPVLTEVLANNLPVNNYGISTRLPSQVVIRGTSIAGNPVLVFTGTASGGTTPAITYGTTLAFTSTGLVSTIPGLQPGTASVLLSVCNAATTNQFCSAGVDVPVTSLVSTAAAVTASPNPAAPTQQISLTARFTPSTNTVAGAPSGLASFAAGSTNGTAPLQLDTTSAHFVPSQTTTISTAYTAPRAVGAPGAGVRPAPADRPYGLLNQEFVPYITDFNKDGVPDLILFDTYQGIVHLYLGSSPGGSFYDAGTLNTPDCNLADMAVGDLNGDGYPDVVYGCNNYSSLQSQIYVALNANGRSLNSSTLAASIYGSQMSLGDFNHDGKLDLLVAGAINSSNTPGFQIFVGNGQGGFGASVTNANGQPSQVVTSQFGAGTALKIADFNNDGYADFAIENYSIGGLPVAINVFQNNSGTFSASPAASIPTPAYAPTYYIGPHAQGGFPDIYYQDNSQFPGVNDIINQGTPTIGFLQTQYAYDVPNISSFSVGDYNGDGIIDFTAYDGSTVKVFLGQPQFGFTATPSTTWTASLNNSVLLSSFDQNGDGYADLLTIIPPSSGTNGSLQTLITTGSAVATYNVGTLPVGTTQVTASYPGTVGLNYASATTAVQVNAITPTVVFPQPAPIVYETALSSTQLQASAYYGEAQVSGTFTFSPAAGTVLHAGTQALTVTFVPNDSTYSTAQASTTITVTRAPSTSFLTWATPAPITYGTALSGAQLDASSGTLQGSFIYSPAAGTVLGVGTQSLSATFTPADTQDYQNATITTALMVNNAPLSLIWPSPAPITYGTALSSTQLDATVSPNVAGTFAYTPAGGTVLSAGTQTLSVTFTPSYVTGQLYQPVSGTTALTVNKAPTTVSWAAPPAITYGTALSSTQLNATVAGNVPGTLTYTPAIGTVLNAGTQTLSVTFTPTDAADYLPSTATTTLTVNKALPVLTWPTPTAISYGTALSSAQLDASVAGNLPGTLTYTPAAGAVLAVGTQTLSVTFTPTDSIDYQPSTASRYLVVNPAASTINWPTPTPIAYGTALSSMQLNATVTGNIPGTFTYTPAAGTVLSAGTQTLGVTFTPTDTQNYRALTASTSIVVNQAVPVLTWAAPAAITYGTAVSRTQLNAAVTGNIPGTLTYTPASGTVLAAGAQTLSVTFTPADSVNYQTATATAALTVNKALPVLTWANPGAITYGTPLTSTQLDAVVAGGVPGALTYTPAAGTVLAAGTQTLNATFTPTDTRDYQNATASATLVINSASTTISWPSPASITYGTPLSSAQLNATVAGNTPGTFTYTPAPGTVLSAGTQTLGVTFTPNDTQNYRILTASTTIVVNKAVPSLTWATPAAITYGTPLSGTQLDAAISGGVAGTLAYSPASGAVLHAGTQSLSVTFTPTDSTDYLTATTTTTLTVNKALSNVTWATPGAITYGTALSSTQLDAAVGGNLPGTLTYTPAVGAVLPVGIQPLTVTFTPADSVDYQSATAATSLVVNRASSALTWNGPAPIVYGTPLSATQLNASINGGVAGSLTYSPGVGTVLSAGTQILTVTFTPADSTSTLPSTATVSLTVNKATPAITWAAPAGVYLGSTLTGAQLNATAAGVTGAALPGSFVYTPPAGSAVTTNTANLSVTFTPSDTVDYTTATATVPLSLQADMVTLVSPSTVSLGSAPTTITVTGVGFAGDATIQVNGSSLPTTFVNSTTLTAVLPASTLQSVKTLPVTVVEPAEAQTSTAMNLPVVAPPVNFAFSAPATSVSADQPKLNLTLVNPYPVDLTGVLTLTFTPAAGSVDDPAIQFSTGGRTATFVVPANSTVTPNIALQTGTVLGQIQISLALTAGGTVVTPASVQPIILTPAAAPPVVTAVTSSVNGNVLTVAVSGYSNTRDLSQANFHFTTSGGPGLSNPDVSVPVTTLFTPWYSSANSTQYGSTFLYTQTFNLSNDFTGISKVSVTLVNSVGTSQAGSTP